MNTFKANTRSTYNTILHKGMGKDIISGTVFVIGFIGFRSIYN